MEKKIASPESQPKVILEHILNFFEIPKKIRLSAVQWIFVIIIVFSGIALRSFGDFNRGNLSFPIQGDGIAIVVHTVKMKNLLLDGKIRLLMENFFEYYSRPSVYILNMFGAFAADRTGQYAVYVLYSIISLLFISLISLKVFDLYTALGTLAVGIFSVAHINYSMKALSSIPCFMLIAGSLYFFFQSHYGKTPARDKIISGLLVGIAFTTHNSAGPLPFIYIITEFYILFTEKEKRKGWAVRFIALLVSMALPLIFWEGICYMLIKTGDITFKGFQHYIWRLLGNESLTYYTEDISPPYLLSMFLSLESVFFLVLILVGIIGGFYSRFFNIEKKHKTFMFMTLVLTVFLCLFPKLCCTLRQLFLLYAFILPLAGLGLAIIYMELKDLSGSLAYFTLAILLLFFINSGYLAAKAVESQQKIPLKIFNFLKEQNVSRLALYGAWTSLPYIVDKRPWPAVSKISDETGYTITLYRPSTPKEVIPLAKEKNIKYFLANYYDYEVRKGWKRHFMFFLHDKGVKKPVRLWKPDPDYFPATYFDELPYKLQIYDKLYAQGKTPLSSRGIAYCSMLYDLSKIDNLSH